MRKQPIKELAAVAVIKLRLVNACDMHSTENAEVLLYRMALQCFSYDDLVIS